MQWTGPYVELLLLLTILSTTYLYLDRATKGKPMPKIRTIPATLAIREGIGRSLEIGKPVHWTCGSDGAPLTGSGMSTTIAALAILRYTARTCAELGPRLIIHLPSQAYSIPLIEGVLREAYAEAGKPERFVRGDMHYYGYLTAAFTPGCYESFSRDGIGMLIHTGSIITYEYPVLEASKIHGAITIGGTPRWTATYIFAMTCDQMFLGEELLAAGAQITGNKFLISGLASEELWKMLALALMGIGFVLKLAGVNFGAILSS
jgi:hypothetical protein